MKINEFKHTGSLSTEITEREQRNRILAREIAEEGIVLLKNDGLLPLQPEKPLSLLGGGAVMTIKGGTGSGDVNERHSVSILEGFRNQKVKIISENWLLDFENRYASARDAWKRTIIEEAHGVEGQLFFDTYSKHPFVMPDGRDITGDDIGSAKAVVYVISRTAGEAKDRRLLKGDYYLTDHEISDLSAIAAFSKNICVVINAGGPIDLSILEEIPEVRAILFMSQAGEEGGNALARTVLGLVNPSGRLTDTWAKRYEDYPCAMEYSNVGGNLDRGIYREGIYVGYRYFDSFGIEPAYHFGYGLSYTSFRMDPKPLSAGADGFTVTVDVSNTGDFYPGKTVVEVYAALPQEDFPKEYKRLVGFSKTKLLAPGETERVTIFIGTDMMTSFSEEKSAWMLSKGDYGIFVGESADEQALSIAGVLTVPGEVILDRVPHIMAVQETFDALVPPSDVIARKTEKWKSTFSVLARAGERNLPVAQYSGAQRAHGQQNINQERIDILSSDFQPGYGKAMHKTVFMPAVPIKFHETTDDFDRMARDIVDNLPVEDLIPFLMGKFSKEDDSSDAAAGGSAKQQNTASTFDAAADLADSRSNDSSSEKAVADVGANGQRVPGSAGETSDHLEKLLHIPGISMADGPAGLRLTRDYTVDKETDTTENIGIAASIEHGFFDDRTIDPMKTEVYHQYTTAWPVGSCLAATWNPHLLILMGQAVGTEMNEYHVSLWLAPGMNIHRNPLCGRNFEYYSEDPLIAGKMAAAITRGVQSRPGVGTTIKHFCCNNQEDNRMGTDAVLSERALREIYLRGFEIAVKEAQPMAIMSSYNLINGLHTANAYDLLTKVLRNEWHFQGLVMTDWVTTSDVGGSVAWKCIKAGNDLIMPGMESDEESIEAAFSEGLLTEEDIRTCAARVVGIVLRSNGYEGSRSYYTRFL